MMEEISHRPSVEYIPPPLPSKARQKGSTTFTQITSDDAVDYGNANALDRSSMHSLVLNTTPATATVFVAARPAERDAATNCTDVPATARTHVVTIRVNTDTEKSKVPKISSVHLKSDATLDGFKKNSLVRINVDDTHLDAEHEERRCDRPPFIYCNPYSLNTTMSTVMSSGQCSPSDTLDSGTCSDLDGTPPPLPKKKTTKVNTRKKAVTVTLIGSANPAGNGELDFEDNDSNISCDSLNSSELNGSVHTDESHEDTIKKAKKCKDSAQELPSFASKDGFLPHGLLRDIRDRTKAESENQRTDESLKEKSDENSIIQCNNHIKYETKSLPVNITKMPIVIEATYEERKMEEEELKNNKKCYSGSYFDTDKYYEFHLNEKQFDVKVKSENVSGSDATDGVEYFAGIKDYKTEDAPSTIKSSKGTIRGVKNRVRAGIATFLQIQTTTKSYKEKDAGKVVLYATTMGIVRDTYQRCVLVKKILRNLLVKYDDRDVFMSTEYQDEIRDRMKSELVLLPQLFVDGHHIGDAETVEKLNESGELRKMLKPYKSPDACTTCQMCGGFRLLPCRICNGSKKSLHRNHFTAEFVALKCMNCDEVGLVRCEVCS